MIHPYLGLPDYQFWMKEKGIFNPEELDPVTPPPFKVRAKDKIVSAGSCFAQNISIHCKKYGFNYHYTEKGHSIINPNILRENGYGIYSARYGNIYTTQQLNQLIQRVYGDFAPIESSWIKSGPGGRPMITDPFRPNIQPLGFASNQELSIDRQVHFECVKQAFEEMDVFIFTLGLTEAWVDKRDGAVFPIAPGVFGGEYNKDTVEFANFGVDETTEHLTGALTKLRTINPDVRIILTVSPVPLNATYENRHVLVSTTLSKSVLRVAAENVVREFDNVYYFPSYEIITSPHVRGAYYGPDCRCVTDKGVEHVMKLLFSKIADQIEASSQPETETQNELARRHQKKIDKELSLLCDEEQLDNK